MVSNSIRQYPFLFSVSKQFFLLLNTLVDNVVGGGGGDDDTNALIV